MIKIKDSNKAYKLYTQIKEIILEKKESPSFAYEISEYLANRDVEEEIKKQYFGEKGEVTFENINGDLVTLKISRWHLYRRWSRYGRNDIPNYNAEIYIGNKLIWNLTSYSKSSFDGEYSVSEVSSLKIPLSILQEKQVSLQENMEEEIAKDEIEEEKKADTISPETRILFEEIEKLHNRYKIEENEKQDLLSKRQKDIEDATKRIIESYNQKLTLNENNIVSVNEEIKIFNKLLVTYSTFNLDLIGYILQQLISITESGEYLYKKVKHTYKKRTHGVMDSWDEEVKTLANIIITKNKLTDSYESLNQSKSKINGFVENGDAVLLSEQDINAKKNKQITFYTLKEGKIECSVNFGKFNYVKEFIDNVIQYRFENKINEITEKDMLVLLQNHIIQHKEEIVKKYESKFNEKVLNLKK